MTFTHSSATAQSKKVEFNTSTIVPGAEGTAKVKKDKNGNYSVDIEIANLADPKKLTPSKQAYIVWIETQEKGVQKIGQIHTSGTMFSKAKKASMTTEIPYKPTKVFVSAEDDPGVGQPGSVVVLSTNAFAL